MFNKRKDKHIDDKDSDMSNKITSNYKRLVTQLITGFVVALTLLTSSVVLAAAHNFTLTAKTLPNGQLAYALGGNEGVIPGPTLFVKKGDTLNITLNNTTSTPVGFKVPGLPHHSSAKVKPCQGETG